MENAQKAIIIGVGIFITIIIIAAVMLISGMGQDLINNSETEVGNISSNLQAQITANFDEKNMTGAQVIAAVKTYYKYDNLAVGVQNKLTKSNEACVKPGAGCILWGPEQISYFSNKRGTDQLSNVANSHNLIENTSVKSLSQMYDKENKATYVRSDEKFIAKLIKYKGSVIGIFFKRLETLD